MRLCFPMQYSMHVRSTDPRGIWSHSSTPFRSWNEAHCFTLLLAWPTPARAAFAGSVSCHPGKPSSWSSSFECWGRLLADPNNNAVTTTRNPLNGAKCTSSDESCAQASPGSLKDPVSLSSVTFPSFFPCWNERHTPFASPPFSGLRFPLRLATWTIQIVCLWSMLSACG